MSESFIGALGLKGAKPMLGGVLANANGALLVLAPFCVEKSLLLRAFGKKGSRVTFGNTSSPFFCVATPTRFLSDGLKQIATVAIARALSFGGPSPLLGSSLETGRDGAKIVRKAHLDAPSPSLSTSASKRSASSEETFATRLAKCKAAVVQLRDSLSCFTCEDDQKQSFVRGFSAVCRDIDVATIPAKLRAMPVALQHPAHELRPFRHGMVIPHTVAPKARALEWIGPIPQSEAELYEAHALKLIKGKIHEIAQWERQRALGVDSRRPKPLFLGIDAYQERWRNNFLRGCSLDLRAGEGSFEPFKDDRVSYQPSFVPPNGSKMASLLEGLHDEELIFMWKHGAFYHDSFPPRIALQPNLLSLLNCTAKQRERAVKEFDTFFDLGFYSTSRSGAGISLPSAPFSNSPLGTVPKDHSEVRIVLDDGAPHQGACLACTSVPVLSSNAATGKLRPSKLRPAPPLPKEVKPGVADAASNDAVLAHIAEISGLGVYVVSIDFWKFFHQSRTRETDGRTSKSQC